MTSTDASSRPQVLIVGMGPTGAALAGLLGQRGVRTEVFDKSADLHPLPRAIGMDHEVMRLAQELGITAALDQHVVPYRPSEYRGVDGDVIKRLDSPPPPFRLGWAPMFAFDQPAFETALRARVSELADVRVSVGTQVLGVGQDDAGAWVDVRRPGAAEVERVHGDYLVACDGGTSEIRETLEIGLTDLGFHENWLVVDAIIDDDDVMARLPQTQVQYCDPARPATFVHLVGRHRRWEISLEPGEFDLGPVDADAVWPWLERWIRPGEATIWRAAAYLFHGLVAEQWRRGRIFLAGDAAHMTPPFMAQGMAQGMRDVQNLAWKLEAVLAGRAGDGLLDTYESERRSHVLTTTRHTIELGRVISERDVDTARARDHAMLALHAGEVPVTPRSSFLPDLADGLLDASSPGSGEIMPQPFVRRGGIADLRLDDVVGRGFVVLSIEPFDAVETASLLEAAEAVGAEVVLLQPPTPGDDVGADALVEQDGIAAAWLTGLGATVAIGRPDHYVYGTARSVEEAVEMLGEVRRSLGAVTLGAG